MARQDFTLWVFRKADAADVLLGADHDDGANLELVLARDAEEVRRFLKGRGSPKQILASSWAAVRSIRQADPALLRVSAEVLKPIDLANALLAALFSQR